MARRYSGDVELRIVHEGDGLYDVAVRAPGERGHAVISASDVGLSVDAWLSPSLLESSATYDRVAEEALRVAEAHAGELPVEIGDRGEVVIRRTFQAPCPVLAPPRRRSRRGRTR